MGRRKKAAKKVVKKKRPIVSKTFKCLFCSQDQAVVCKMDKFKSRTGHLQCTACDAEFTSSVTHLSEPIDIYHEWLDKLAAAQGEESRKFLDEHPVDQNAFDDDVDDGARLDDDQDSDDE